MCEIIGEKIIKRRERKRNEYHKRKKINCLNCGAVTTNKFCDGICQQEFYWKIKKEKIENGETTFSNKIYKKFLIEKHGEKCMECGWNKRNPITNNVPIELEHKDGNSFNNNLTNLMLLCPNCHSLTPTYKALNKGNGRYKRRERYKEGKSF